MSRRLRVVRRPDHWATTHARARSLAADRLAKPLRPSEMAWLNEHLTDCDACAAIAAAYESDRLALRSLRDVDPQPPRDLWARTAAGIEREATARHRARPIMAGSRARIPVGALSGLAVVALVVGLSAISSGLFGSASSMALAPIGSDPGGTTQGDGASAPEAATPDATPITVRPGNVQWLDGSGGQLAYNHASIDEVCPVDDTADCGPLAEASARHLTVSGTPRTIIESPVDGQAAVVGADGSGGDQVVIVALPVDAASIAANSPAPSSSASVAPVTSDPSSGGPGTTSQPSAAASPGPTVEPSPAASPEPTVQPSAAASPEPSESALPSDALATTAAPTIDRTATPTASPAASPSAQSSEAAPSTGVPSSQAPPSPVPPSPAPASPESSQTPSPLPTPSAAPSAAESPAPTAVSPEPTPDPTVSIAGSPSPAATAAATLAIASGVEVLGDTAAFSPDGRWFAFTARPADGSAGPDIHVWHIGNGRAQAVTSDGMSVFASWDGDRLIGSRPRSNGTSERESNVQSFALDPATGAETPIASDLWRPVIDPTARRAVAWIGSVAQTDELEWQPARGSLQLVVWNGRPGANRVADRNPVTIATIAAPTDFDVRWDETGEWFGVWAADASAPAIGRLSLYRIDPATGDLEIPDTALTEIAALPGFSIGEGRMAWATPPGQGGEGSRIQVVAWKGDDVGTVETVPGEDIVVVR